MDTNDNAKCELEDQFVLRLPQKYADDVHKILKTKPKKLKKTLFLNIDPDARSGHVIVNKRKLEAKLISLPTINESYKTIDRTSLFKTADVSQMLLCQEEPFDENQMKKYKQKPNPIKANNRRLYELPHGITPPMKNVKKYRFRKTLKNNDALQEAGEIEKEIIYLLRMDFEAVATKYEIFYEEPKIVQTKHDNVNEHYIFGDIISDSNSEQDSASDSNDIIEYTN